MSELSKSSSMHEIRAGKCIFKMRCNACEHLGHMYAVHMIDTGPDKFQERQTSDRNVRNMILILKHEKVREQSPMKLSN